MYQAGRISIYIGIGLVALGLIIGFGLMWLDHDDEAKIFIGLVPIGFVLLLAGTVSTLLAPPRDKP